MEKVSSSIGTQYRYYIEGADQLAAIVASTGSGTPTVDYVLEDHEGSIAALLNSTGTIAANESFTAYGNRREASTWSGAPSATEEAIMDGITRQGFTGQTALGQMGLNHMNGRVEDAVTGTFLSSDPRIDDPYNTQDYNRYAYVYNNPLTNFDPTGFDDTAAPPQVPWPGPGIDVYACGVGSTTFTVGGITGCAPAPDFAPVPPIGSSGSEFSFSGTGGQNQQQQRIPCSAANSSGKGLLVQLAYTKAHSSFGITVPDASHTFVIVTDPSTGASYVSRGGPGSGPGGGPGIGWDQVTAMSGPYNSRFPDYGSVTAVQNVGYLNVPYNTAVGYLNSFAATTGANDLRYEGYTQNSNSYSAALLNGLGFTPPDPAKNAPGYGSNPPSPQLECKP